VDRARLLRKKATEPERILWRHLRNRNFAGHKFRRQHPFDDYVLDFYCPSAKLAIELDGGGHTVVQGKFAIGRDRNSWLAMESLCCDSGTIRFAKSSTACCEQSGSHLRATTKQTLTFILSLWERERQGLAHVPSVKVTSMFGIENHPRH
jgi:very-short-patch-repair endonuclease